MIKMAKFRQSFPRPLVADIPATVHRELALVMQGRDLKPGAEIAITAGSRGINNFWTTHVTGRGKGTFRLPQKNQKKNQCI
jgi:hypothetical protein